MPAFRPSSFTEKETEHEAEAGEHEVLEVESWQEVGCTDFRG